jgi:hypothetical protein
MLQPLTVDMIPADPPPVLIVVKFHIPPTPEMVTCARETLKAAFRDASKPCPPFIVIPPGADINFAALPDLFKQMEAAGFARADQPAIVE